MEHDSLERRLAPYATRGGQVDRSSFRRTGAQGLRARIERRIEEAVTRFEVGRLLYDIEVDAMSHWLRVMVAFDAYYARHRG